MLSHLNTKILHSLRNVSRRFAYDFANGGCRSKDRVNLKSLIPDHHSVDLLNANRWNRQLLRNPQSQVSWDMLNTTANAPASSSVASAKILSSAAGSYRCSRADVQTGVRPICPITGSQLAPDGRLFVPLLDIPPQLPPEPQSPLTPAECIACWDFLGMSKTANQ